MNEVFTYFEDFGTESSTKHKKIVELYVQNWQAMGYKVEVLGLKDAIRHPDYSSYKRTVGKFPTVNGRSYELACFMRWLALDQVSGRFMTDYDVFNIDFDSETFIRLVSNYAFSSIRVLNLDAGRVPCAVYVADELASHKLLSILKSKRMARLAETTIDGKRHVSDMHMFANLEIGDMEPICHLATEGFPLRHFSSDSTGGLDFKISAIREALKLN